MAESVARGFAGYPCCCDSCAYTDKALFEDDFSETLGTDWNTRSFYTQDGYLMAYVDVLDNHDECFRYACFPSPSESLHIENEVSIWFLAESYVSLSLFFGSPYDSSIRMYSVWGADISKYGCSCGSGSTIITTPPQDGDTLKITIDGTATENEYDVNFYLNASEVHSCTATINKARNDSLEHGVNASTSNNTTKGKFDNYTYSSTY